MNHILIIQSYIRSYICRKQYIRIYSAIYRIQCFILDRNDRKNLLQNITYLAKFATSTNKAAFLQEKAKKTISTAISKVTTEYKEDSELLQCTIHNLRVREHEKDTIIQELQTQNKNLSDTVHSLQTQIDQFLQNYTESNEANHSLTHVNESLEDMNRGLCTKLGDIYLDLSKTTEELHKHKHKTVWDVLFNRVK